MSVTLVTGFGATDLANRVVEQLLREDDELRIVAPVQESERAAAEARLGNLTESRRGRVRLLTAEPEHMDFGLSGRDYLALAGDLRVIHHCAATRRATAPRKRALATNVNGARELVELALAARDLERLVIWSAASVSGARKGYVFENELRAPAGFRSAVEESLFRAERLVRETMHRIPTTILRPSLIVGDSTTGALEHLEGPYLLVQLMLSAPPDLRIPIPARPNIPLHLVPIDYVVDAGLAILRDPRSLGQTFHLVDPHPESVAKVFEILARATGRGSPRGRLPTGIATALLRVPGLRKATQAPRSLLEHLATEVVYDDRNTQDILAATRLRCPPFETYAEKLVTYVKSRRKAASPRQGKASRRRS